VLVAWLALALALAVVLPLGSQILVLHLPWTPKWKLAPPSHLQERTSEVECLHLFDRLVF
jgi:hypothetical protein